MSIGRDAINLFLPSFLYQRFNNVFERHTETDEWSFYYIEGTWSAVCGFSHVDIPPFRCFYLGRLIFYRFLMGLYTMFLLGSVGRSCCAGSEFSRWATTRRSSVSLSVADCLADFRAVSISIFVAWFWRAHDTKSYKAPKQSRASFSKLFKIQSLDDQL